MRLNINLATKPYLDVRRVMLRQPQNIPVLNTSKFLNGLIARKSFSWTRVFMQLEQIMPPRLHVVSISPELQPATNTVEVHLTVAGTSREAAVELVKRLEQSPSFREARIVEESSIQGTGSPDTVQFHVVAVYMPRKLGTSDSMQAVQQDLARGGAQ